MCRQENGAYHAFHQDEQGSTAYITGQYYLRARYYNPVVGRFLQEDTYRGDGLNLYAYCANNPVMYFDPSGQNGVYPDNKPNPGSAKERTMLHAIEIGKIQAGEAKLSGLRKQLQEIFEMDVDVSIISEGGIFDNPPFIPFNIDRGG